MDTYDNNAAKMQEEQLILQGKFHTLHSLTW